MFNPFFIYVNLNWLKRNENCRLISIHLSLAVAAAVAWYRWLLLFVVYSSVDLLLLFGLCSASYSRTSWWCANVHTVRINAKHTHKRAVASAETENDIDLINVAWISIGYIGLYIEVDSCLFCWFSFQCILFVNTSLNGRHNYWWHRDGNGGRFMRERKTNEMKKNERRIEREMKTKCSVWMCSPHATTRNIVHIYLFILHLLHLWHWKTGERHYRTAGAINVRAGYTFNFRFANK